MPGTSPGTPLHTADPWGLAPSPPRRASPPALRPVVNTSMAPRADPISIAPEVKAAPFEETKYLPPTLASITESLSLLGLSPETLAMSFGESLAERYLASIRTKPCLENSLFSSCVPQGLPVIEPALQLFSNDFMDYLNKIDYSDWLRGGYWTRCVNVYLDSKILEVISD